MVAVLWFIWAALVGLSSPWTYRWTLKHLLPRLNAHVDGDIPPPPVDTADDKTVIVDKEESHVR